MNIQIRVRPEPLPSGSDVETAIRWMASEYAALTHMPDWAAPIAASALEREQSEPTYISRAMAVPHARVARLPEAGLYLARSEEGIPWPEERASVVILLVVPLEEPELYLRMLGRLVRWRMKSGICDIDALKRAMLDG